VSWVEHDTPPQAIVATKYVDNAFVDGTHSLPAPVGPALEMTRLICPYPEEAQYRGGDPKVAASFACVRVRQDEGAFEVPAREYLAPFAIQARAVPSELTFEDDDSDLIKVVLTAERGADDFRRWTISALKAEGVPAVSSQLSSDRRIYTATFPRSAVDNIADADLSRGPIGLTITGEVMHDDNQSTFATSATIRVSRHGEPEPHN
jgi:hypothetical protein